MTRDRTTLTPRERECVQLAGEGASAKAIRERLGLGTERTVQTYLHRAYVKLGVHNRHDALRALNRLKRRRSPVTLTEPAPSTLKTPRG